MVYISSVVPQSKVALGRDLALDAVRESQLQRRFYGSGA